MKNIIYLLPLLLNIGCATVFITEPEKPSRPEYFGPMSDRKITDIETVKEDITRSAEIMTTEKKPDGRLSKKSTYTKIEMIPCSEFYIKTKTISEVNDQAYKEKWDEAKKSKTLTAKLKEAESLFKATTCFQVYLFGKTESSVDIKAWHGDLILADNTKRKLDFIQGLGYETKKTYLYTDKYSSDVYDVRDYSYFTFACTNKLENLTLPFSVEIDARIAKDTIPVTLKWNLPNK